jgi:inorganic pyrophosphatase
MDLSQLPTFAEPDVFHVVVESPRGSSLKLKYEPQWHAMMVSRPLPFGVAYPFDWGFVPSTKVGDGDPLDVMIVWDVASFPGVVLRCRAIAVLQVEQNRRNHDRSERVRNDRILAIPIEARRQESARDLPALPDRVREELEQFAHAATALEGKDVRILGWGDAAAALQLVRASAIP